MGEINFLTNGPADTNNDNKSDKDKESKLSKPLASNSGKTSGFFGFKKEVEKLGNATEKERIEKSRQEVLEMIERNKKNNKEKKPNEIKSSADKKTSHWLGNIFGSAGEGKKLAKNSTSDSNAIKASISPEKNEPKSSIQGKVSETGQTAKTLSLPENNISKTQASVADLNKEIQKTESVIKSNASISASRPVATKNTDNKKSLLFNSNTWNNPGVLETNLIDKSGASFLDSQKKIQFIFAGVFSALAIVVGLYLGILYYEHTKLEALKIKKASISELEIRAKKLEEEIKPAAELQGKLVLVEKLLDKHIYMNNLLKFLEEKTLSNVFFVDSFAFAVEESLNLSAETDDYESAKNQIIVFNKDNRVKSLKMSNIEPFVKTLVPASQTIYTDPLTGLSTVASSTPEIKKTGTSFNLEIEIDQNLFNKMELISTTTTATTTEDIVNE